MDYGVKVGQRGTDVENAADYQLLFSSGWPILKIAAQGTVVLSDPTNTSQVLYTHNLGFAPLYWVWGLTAGGRAEFLSVASYLYGVNTTELKYFAPGFDPGFTQIFYVVFRANLETNFAAPLYNTTVAVPNTATDFGLRIAKSGKSAESTDQRDLALTTQSRALQIHQSGFGTAGGASWSQTISHALGYEPFFMVFTRETGGVPSGYWQLIDQQDQNRFAQADSLTIQFGAINAGHWAYIIFKDPFTLS